MKKFSIRLLGLSLLLAFSALSVPPDAKADEGPLPYIDGYYYFNGDNCNTGVGNCYCNKNYGC